MSIGDHFPDVLARTMVTDKCWVWLGSVSTKGYGQLHRNGTAHQVHHIALASVGTLIPAGMVVDHTCHDPAICNGGTCVHRRCVNPAHLAVTTNAENLSRQAPAFKTHCINGHELAGDNLKRTPEGRRRCAACSAAQAIRWRRTRHDVEPRVIREWARENGIPVSQRGVLPVAVLDAYIEAHQPKDAA